MASEGCDYLATINHIHSWIAKAPAPSYDNPTTLNYLSHPLTIPETPAHHKLPPTPPHHEPQQCSNQSHHQAEYYLKLLHQGKLQQLLTITLMSALDTAA
jgi:hypothetical protein